MPPCPSPLSIVSERRRHPFPPQSPTQSVVNPVSSLDGERERERKRGRERERERESKVSIGNQRGESAEVF